MRSNKFHQGFVGEINSEILVLSPVLLHGFNVPIYNYIWLLVAANPSENYESLGIMKFPMYGEKKDVPNHQPDIV